MSASSTRNETITALLIDARPWTREAYARALESASKGLRVLAHSDISDVAQTDFHDDTPLVLLNLTGSPLNDSRASAVFDAIRSRLPESPIMVISDSTEVDEIFTAVEGGVNGYLPISLELQRVVAAMRFVAAGGTFIPAEWVLAGIETTPASTSTQEPTTLGETARAMSREADSSKIENLTLLAVLEGLTPKERAVLAHLREGISNKLIARALDISEATVKVHVRHIMRKMGAANRTQVALMVDRLAEDQQFSIP